MEEMLYIPICPKCGQSGIPNKSRTIGRCRFCSTQLIETDMNILDYSDCISDGTDEAVDRELFERYVRDNPLYDPDEVELSKAKREEEKNRVEAQDAAIRAARAAKEAAKPRCPICHSTNIEKIGTVRKGVSIAVFGLLSNDIGKMMVCKDCGYKF